MQTGMMFAGELSVFIVYGFKKWNLKREAAKKGPNEAPMSPVARQANAKQLKMNPNPLILAIPASFDFTASTLMFVALTMCPPSIYQMMRGFVTVITAIFSIIFLKRKQYRHHWTGLACIITALVEIGYVAIAFEGTGSDGTGGSVAVGILLILLAQVFVGGLFITEEYFLGDYYLDPLKVVGTEGMFGLAYLIMLLPIMQLIQCSGTTGLESLCNFNYLENSSYALAQMKAEPTIIVYALSIMISIAFFNVCGVTTTKVASAA